MGDRRKQLVGVLAIVVLTVWNGLVRTFERPIRPRSDGTEPRVTEHERGWRRYLRGFDAHHGPDGEATPDTTPEDGSLRRGLVAWYESNFLRGYTIDDHVYVCRSAPRVVRIHQAGHTPTFGDVFDPIRADYRENGGLPDEPLRTLDVMLPGRFPHTFLRLTDRRGLRGAYRVWIHDGVIQRTTE